jgi:hypothetical protein
LGGSWARGDSTTDSDVDLCLISATALEKKQLEHSLRRLVSTTGSGRVLVDAKVFTVDEFQAAIHSTQNLFLYAFFLQSRLLHGHDVRVRVQFLRQYLKPTLWTALKEVREAMDYLQQAVMVASACYKLWTALTTLFIAEHLSQHRALSKSAQTAFFKNLFGSQFAGVKAAYERVRWQMRRQADYHRVKVRRREALKCPKNIDMLQLIAIAERIRQYGQQIYRSVD